MSINILHLYFIERLKFHTFEKPSKFYMQKLPQSNKQDARCENPKKGTYPLRYQVFPGGPISDKTDDFIKNAKVFNRLGEPVKLTQSSAITIMMKFFFDHVNINEPIHLKS